MIEYEARVLEINKEELEKKLKNLGAEKIADFEYKRRVYDFNPKEEGRWIRLRTNGKKTTLTIKEIKSQEIDGTEETEIEVSDFEKTNIILNKLGYIEKSYQENKRTRYGLDGVEIDIDTWPYIPTYVEIEGKSANEVQKTIKKLGLENEKITSLDVQAVYEKFYGIDLRQMSEVRFNRKLDPKYIIKK
jgi:adenylate cyclase class 2